MSNKRALEKSLMPYMAKYCKNNESMYVNLKK